MSKLTLNVADDVISRAKGYAHQRGTSVSRLVETYLHLLTRPFVTTDKSLPPITRRLRGVVKCVEFDRTTYTDYLVRKYR